MQVLGCWHAITVGVGVKVGEGDGVLVGVASGIHIFEAVATGPSPHEFIGVTLHVYL
jgi:hypothetical protein